MTSGSKMLHSLWHYGNQAPGLAHKQNLNLQKLAPQLSPDKALIVALSVDRDEFSAQNYAEQHAWPFLTAMMTPEWSAT